MANERRPGIFRQLMSHLVNRIRAIPRETIQTASEKVIPQGAAELSQALFSQSNAYVAYGAGQRPLPVQAPQQSYQDMLKAASQQRAPQQQRGMGMDL